MEEETLGTEVAISRESQVERVNAWRVDQLANLGLPTVIASAVATVVDGTTSRVSSGKAALRSWLSRLRVDGAQR